MIDPRSKSTYDANAFLTSYVVLLRREMNHDF